MVRVSLCMIVKDEEQNLAQCLDSVYRNVDEIIVVDTGSTDRTTEVAERYGAKVFRWDRGNHPEGFFLDDEETGKKIQAPPPYSDDWAFANFGEARNESFRHATGDFILWLDADDVVEHPENIRKAAQEMEASGASLGFIPYNYQTDEKGRVWYRQWRERLIRRGVGHWVNPVHEVHLPSQPLQTMRFPDVVVQHRRKADRKSIPNRNYKILLYHLWRQQTENPGAPVDPRTLYYLAQECRFIEPIKAIGFLEQYLKVSGWAEERAAAHVCLGQLAEYGVLADKLPPPEVMMRAYRDYATAAMEQPDNPDGLFGMARVAYHRQRWHDCITLTERGFQIGNTDSMLGANPMDRLYRPHAYYSHALAMMGRVEEAAASCRAALSVCPDDPGVPGGASGMIAFNLARYEDQMKTPPNDGLRPVVEFGLNEDLETPPNPATPVDAMAIWAIQLWKHILGTDGPAKARSFLDSLPKSIATHRVVEKMRGVTERRRSNIPVFSSPTYERSVVFWLGPCFEHWDPTSPSTKGLGGSETAAVEMAKHLRRLGYQVRVYAEADGEWDGVRYLPWRSFQGEECDIFISSRSPAIADYAHVIKAKQKLLWVHDIHVGQSPQMPHWLAWFDRVLCLSNWHKGHFLQTYPYVPADRVEVTRNGIDPDRFTRAGANPKVREMGIKSPKRNSMVFSSSPNRGLLPLLENFKAIKMAVPDAELHVCYGFDCWETMCKLQNDTAGLQEIARYKAILDEATQRPGSGVYWHGRVDQQKLAQLFLESKVWGYLTDFPETSCISAMEAQAAGAVPVASRFAALQETVQNGILINKDSQETLEWLREVIGLMKDEGRRAPMAAAGRVWALKHLTWSGVADQWHTLFQQWESPVKVEPKTFIPAVVQPRPIPEWRRP